MKRLKVYLLGLKDGFDQYPNFGTGMTYPDLKLNEAYDRGVNMGELLARVKFIRAWHYLP